MGFFIKGVQAGFVTYTLTRTWGLPALLLCLLFIYLFLCIKFK